MKIGKGDRTPHYVSFDMTPMIDCCFQLIIFFMLSMRIYSAEGDFNIKMPLAAAGASQVDESLPAIKVRMKAGPDGQLASLQMGARTFTGADPFAQLNHAIRGIVGDDRGPGAVTGQTEVELDCDYNLRYEYIIRAISAVSGYVDSQGQIVKVVEKIKFAPRRQE